MTVKFSNPLHLVLPTTDGDEPWVINSKIFSVLNTYLQPNTSLSALDAALEINKLFPLYRPSEGNAPNEEPASFLLEMWGVVISVAEQIPWKDAALLKLVAFVQALKELPDPPLVHLGSWGSFRIWEDLPLLGPEMIETSYAVDLDDVSETQKIIRRRQENFVAFAAHLTRAGLADRSKYHALYYFREAFEQSPGHDSAQQRAHLNLCVPLAGIWILIAGPVIFAHCRKPPARDASEFDDKGDGFEGPDGFSIERWEFWKKKLIEIRDRSDVDDKTKTLATEVEDAMRKIEADES